MSTDRRTEVARLRRWLVPGLCVAAAGGYAAVFLATGKVGLAISCAAIMLAYGALLIIFSRRSEVAAILRDDAADERRVAINLRASALALHVIALVAVTMAFVELAQNRDPGAWGTICAVLGGSYIAGVILFSRRT